MSDLLWQLGAMETAELISKKKIKDCGAIASKLSAKIYKLDIVSKNVEK